MSSLASVKESIATTGATIVRPFRYAGNLLKGTFTGGLDGMANWGRKGFWAGLGFGIFAGIAGGAVIATALPMAIGGFALAAAAGTVIGAVRGGTGAVGREYRRDKYASEVAERQEARAAREARSHNAGYAVDHRESYRRRTGAANFNFERQLQQERENDRDYGTYWQDRMDASRSQSNGRGF